MSPWRLIAATSLLLAASAAMAVAQRQAVFRGGIRHPAIRYETAPTQTAVDALNRTIAAAAFPHDESSGYLRATLDALDVPVESQVLVYTKTSLQYPHIDMQNPRAVYFNDTVAVGFVRGAPLLEVWAQDPHQGTVFYSLSQQPRDRAAPTFERDGQCLACHLSEETLGVPGPFLFTTFPREHDYQGADGFVVDHRDQLDRRWGGWYVTGQRVPARHMGNLPLFMPDPPAPPGSPAPPAPPRLSLADSVNLSGYPTPHSDVVALMVLEHQLHAMNLMTRLGWEARVGNGAQVLPSAGDLVDYLLFVREAPIDGRIEGSSGFAEKFSAMGPKDSKGRSLRELQLDGRLMKYPLSYMIYSPAFGGLPHMAKGATLARLREVLSGADADRKYEHLTPEICSAILEILADTLPDFSPSR